LVGLHGDDKAALTRAAAANDVSAPSVRFWVQKWKNDGSVDQLIAAQAITNLAAEKKKRKGKAATTQEPPRLLKRKDPGFDAAYSKAYKRAGELARVGELSQSKIAALVSRGFNCEFSPTTAFRSKLTVDLSPVKRGREPKYPIAAEKMLVKMITKLRLLKLPTYQHSICNYAARLIKGTVYEKHFLSEDGERIFIPKWWYYRFLQSNHAQELRLTKGGRSLEEARHRWATADNMLKHYNVVQTELLRVNIAEANPAFNPEMPESCPITIKQDQKHRVLSFDETHWTSDMTQNFRDGMVAIHNDSMDVLASKSSRAATLIGGSNMAGDALPLGVVFGGMSVDGSWVLNPPLCTKIDPATGSVYRPVCFANASGGMTHDLGIQMLKALFEPFCHDISPTNEYIIICDGHGSHLTVEFLQYAREKGFVIILRPPHTSHISQGEDVIHFRKFKRHSRGK
jgi:transposase-like protein